MEDLINRDSAIVVACKQIKDDGIAFDVKEAIKALPTADTCPYYCELLPGTEKQCIKIRQGKWIPVGVPGEDYECDQCGYICEAAFRTGTSQLGARPQVSPQAQMA